MVRGIRSRTPQCDDELLPRLLEVSLQQSGPAHVRVGNHFLPLTHPPSGEKRQEMFVTNDPLKSTSWCRPDVNEWLAPST